MKKILLFIPAALLTLALSGCATTPPPITPLNEEKELDFTNLVWSDEFDSETLNLENWSFDIGTGTSEGLTGWGNEELEYYTDKPENVSLRDGNLVITALRQNYRGASYTSARIQTKNNVDVKYGRIEASIKMPRTQGIWPAFWMLPTDKYYGGWAASGEIDIIEMTGNKPETAIGTIHFGGQWPENMRNGRPFKFEDKRDITQDFHLFAVEWTEEYIAWFIDDIEYHRVPADEWITFSEEEDINAPFDQRFYIILNIAVGGIMPGEPDETTVFPQEMLVDYVRVYR